ncbi:1-aminocyclopropane-1-carboxylate deaminase [Pseudoroseomonas deserti]|uniref:Aminotransferase n=1 Tax=Teichococcus deserti TaxID=1817963 RepID=A0A1V2GYI8_9PROT|nr:aminotransferase class I/II-fold pyridoxal phosphate-dependent enzyme [Pseudoroseomonas deserti]ONG50206.1 1-aminocyclopropane-1-carboxylate deaminase [Pseudoroseomonas deserti]
MLKTGRGAEAPPFLVMDVIAAANARAAAQPPGAPAVLRMEVGQPSTGAPRGAAEAAMRALSAGAPMGYTEAFGLPSLRARISRHYADKYGAVVPAGRIAVTVGASGAFPLAFLAAFDPGDRVAMAAPFYPPYANILTSLGMVPQLLPCDASTRFQPTIAMLEALDPRPEGLIVASPCNPAGTMLAPAELEAIARWCHGNGVRLVSDEIYHGLSYGMAEATAAGCSVAEAGPGSLPAPAAGDEAGGRLSSASLSSASLGPSAIVINSFSKYWAMTGWRIGWMVLPDDLIRPVETLAQNMFISAPHVAQVAAQAAMDCTEELEANRERYRRNRDILMNEMPGAGFPQLASADGAFYLWADISHRTNDSLTFCARMLAEIGVAATPGVDFDPDRGGRFLRLSYCGAEADILDAVRRLRAWR